MVEPVSAFNFWGLACNLLGVETIWFSQQSPMGMLIFTTGLFFILYLLIYIVHAFTRLMLSVLSAGRYRD